MLIRNVKEEDLLQVAEINVNGWKTAYRGIISDEYLDKLSVEENYEKRLKEYKSGEKNGFVVGVEYDQIVGFCKYRVGNEYYERYPEVDCEICALYVKPEYKRNGFGQDLIRFVKNEFKSKGLHTMIVWCLKDNYPSRKFYTKMGGVYCGKKTIEIDNIEYEEAGFKFDLDRFCNDKLELVFPTIEYKEKVEEYLQEFFNNGEFELAGDASLDHIRNFDEWLKKVENDRMIEIQDEEKVQATTYLTVRKYDNKVVGNIQIRHSLNEKLLHYGGHIGDSVRPSERRKGYATEQIRLALKNAKNLVLIEC